MAHHLQLHERLCPQASDNLAYFLSKVGLGSDAAHYVIALDPRLGEKETQLLPDLPPTASYYRPTAICFELGTVGEVIFDSGLVSHSRFKCAPVQPRALPNDATPPAESVSSLACSRAAQSCMRATRGAYAYPLQVAWAEQGLVCRYFVWADSRVRGPFLPSYVQEPWHTHLTAQLRGSLKLFGGTISCAGLKTATDPNGWQQTPHVQVLPARAVWWQAEQRGM